MEILFKRRKRKTALTGKFLNKFIQQQVLQQRILQKLETQVSTTTMDKIREAREQHLEKFGGVKESTEIKN